MITLSQKQLRDWTPSAGAFIVTDLDECAINSDHRRNFCPETGELDIPKWHENSTPKNIDKDTLRPWGIKFAELVIERADCHFAICTSREFSDADFDYMSEHLGMTDKMRIWSRPWGCGASRSGLKHDLFVAAFTEDFEFCLAVNQGRAYFFDDKVENVLVAEQLGLIGILVY
jgi:hypothetical protein